jgi:carbon monoxide dehydrogenase subunit G
MQALRRIFYWIVIAIVVLAAIGLFLPRQIHVERSIAVNAPPAAVFGIVNGFARFNEYSPWFEADPSATYTYEGPATGVGAKMSWASEDRGVGSGSQQIVKSEPPRSVQSRLEFGGDGTAFATWTIDAVDGGSNVTWALDTDLGMNPAMRYMGLAFDRLIGRDYERGLARLKSLAESQPATNST